MTSLILLFLTAISAHAYDLAALKKTIAENRITTIDQLVPALPESLKYNATFLYHPMGAIQGDETDPRAILFDPLGKFAISFTGRPFKGYPEDGYYNDIEIFQFDSKARQFSYLVQSFPLTQSNPFKPHTQPNCLGCHGNDSRPVWQEYPKWVGAYGSDDDYLRDKEKTHFEKFRAAELATAKVKVKSRYLQLFPTQDSWQNFPYRMDDNPDETIEPLNSGFRVRPNLRLNALLGRLNAQRVARILENSSAYQAHREAYLAGFLGCGPKEGFIDQTPEQVRHFREMLKDAGITLKDIDLRFTYSTPIETYEAVDWRDSYFDGTATQNELIAYQLFLDVAAHNPNLKQHFHPRNLEIKNHRMTDRNLFDLPIFQDLDSLGGWVPMPYLGVYGKRLHRDAFSPELRANYFDTCAALQ